MKLVGAVTVAALVLGAAVTGWVRAAGAPAGAPTTPKLPPTTWSDPGADAPAGMDVRYLDADGKIQRLDVKDFPR